MWQRSAILQRGRESEGARGMLDGIRDGLTIADSGFAVLGGLIVAAGYSVRPLRRRWQRRPSQVQKRQAAKLDQLGLGRPLETIEAALGSPHLLNRSNTPEGQSEERIYRLPGAWVALYPREDAVAAYSITITDAALYYDTANITRGAVAVCLGRSLFADSPTQGATDAFEIYAHLATFHRYYDYGSNAAGGQYIWLAHNPGGAGVFDGASASADWMAHTAQENAAACDLSLITVNTIAICDWHLHPSMSERGYYGPHPDNMR